MMEINETYNEKETITIVKEIYKQNPKVPSATLQQFFTEYSYKRLQKEVINTKKEVRIDYLHHKYKECPGPKELESFLNKKEFIKLLHKITGKTYNKISLKSFVLSWKDYSLIHDKHIEKPGLDIIIDLTESWDYKDGGAVIYVDGTGDYAPVISERNSLTIVKRTPTVRKFIKYINNRAKGKERTLLIGTAV